MSTEANPHEFKYEKLKGDASETIIRMCLQFRLIDCNIPKLRAVGIHVTIFIGVGNPGIEASIFVRGFSELKIRYESKSARHNMIPRGQLKSARNAALRLMKKFAETFPGYESKVL